ncbi:hypothetical protein LJC17_03110 [Acholeplasma sp. OttesenSCG-928-E16]|nr:hypothetical protein [Acholeplasma sp. OttesenSCG-928-E16]
MKLKVEFMLSCLCLLTLCSCDSNNVDEVSFGFETKYYHQAITSRVSLGAKALKSQDIKSKFTISFGAVEGFEKDWNDDLFECNPGYGTFAIQREIRTKNEFVIQTDYKFLPDFPSDEKYLLEQISIPDTMDGYVSSYSYSFEDEFDFSLVDLEQGYINYAILYYDDIKEQPFEDNVYLYGIDWGGKFSFNKKGSIVEFDTGYE